MYTKIDTSCSYAINTDCAAIINKNNSAKEIELYDQKNRRIANFSQDIIPTTFLTACMAIKIESEDTIFLLHVSPSQAKNETCIVIKPYSHLKSRINDKNIVVNVFGHIENFDEEIFSAFIREYGVKSVLSLTIHQPPLQEGYGIESHLYRAKFDLKNETVEVSSLRGNELSISYPLAAYESYSPIMKRIDVATLSTLSIYQNNSKRVPPANFDNSESTYLGM